jgi:hypothetical protein
MLVAAAEVIRKVSDKERLALGLCPRSSCRKKEIKKVTLNFFQEEMAKNGYGTRSFSEKELSKVLQLWYRSARSV